MLHAVYSRHASCTAGGRQHAPPHQSYTDARQSDQIFLNSAGPSRTVFWCSDPAPPCAASCAVDIHVFASKRLGLGIRGLWFMGSASLRPTMPSIQLGHGGDCGIGI